MGIRMERKNFEEIYHKTYQETLKYIISQCNKVEDVNDLLQEVYVELYKKLKKNQTIEVEDVQGFLIGISKNIIKRYYRFWYRKQNKIVNLEEKVELIDEKIDLELQFVTKENVSEIWDLLKTKDVKIAKIFYFYYGLDLKIKEIAKELNLTESGVKNYLYRTIKELKNSVKKEDDENGGK